jgi:N-acetyltransferase
MKANANYFAKVTLKGERVRLEPLSERHLEDLSRSGSDAEIWKWLPREHHGPGAMASFVDSAVLQFRRSAAVPFATIDIASAKAVGSTRFHYVEPEQRRLEIGFTWIAPEFQRSYVNTETKFLQLWYAFEILKCRRVEFKADADNLKSRTAILRLGAKEEGYFRKHMLYPDGRNRDSVYYSIIDDEWPACKTLLQSRMGYAVNPECFEPES